MVFIITQLIFKFAHFDKPADDFKYYFWNNANNIQPVGCQFESLDGKKYVADGDINRFGYTPPIYTYLVAGIIIFGGGLNSIFFLNVLLMILVLLISKKIFELITSNQVIIYLSLWLMVVNPLFINIPRLYLSEALFSFLTIAAIYFYIVTLITKTSLPYIIGLFLLIISIETRAINLYLIPVFAFALVFAKLKIVQKIGLTVLSIVSFFILTSISSSESSKYLRRTVADGLSRFEKNPIANKLYNSVRPHQENWQITFKDELILQATENPVAFIKLYSTKFAKSWYATDSGENELFIFIFQILHLFAFIILLLLYLIRKFRDPKIFLLLLIILYTNIIVMGTLSICRYMSPIAPLYIFCTVYLGSIIYIKYFSVPSLRLGTSKQSHAE